MGRLRDEDTTQVAIQHDVRVFIEQNPDLALSLAHRGYILESGRLLLEGAALRLLASDEVRKVFLGL